MGTNHMSRDRMPSFDGFPDSHTKSEIDERYAWVGKQRQKYHQAQLLGNILRFAMRPKVTFADDDAVRKSIESDRVLAMVGTHKHLLDPFATVAAVHQQPSLRNLQETRRSARRAETPRAPHHTRPMTKIDLSRESDPVGRFARPLLAVVASTPVPREKDSDTEKGRYARKKAMEVTENGLIRGINSLSFPSGTRSKEKFDIEATRSGMAYIALRAAGAIVKLSSERSNPEEHDQEISQEHIEEYVPTGVTMLPFAVSYRKGLNFWRRPRLHFGNPIDVEPYLESLGSSLDGEEFKTAVTNLHQDAMAEITQADEVLSEAA